MWGRAEHSLDRIHIGSMGSDDLLDAALLVGFVTGAAPVHGGRTAR